MRTLRPLPARTGFFAATIAAALLSGCAEVVRATPDEVSVDTFSLGEIMPGTRRWLAWASAREHCAARGKSPEIHDLQGTVVTYRCVAR